MNDTRPIRLPGAAPRPVDLPPDLDAVRFDAAGATDRGKQRARNEDAFAVAPLVGRDGMLLVVCDGLGGAHGGEVASRIAVDVTVDELARRPLPADRTLRLALRRAVERASQALDETAKARPELATFGTTLTAALVAWPEMWIAHVGDSRAYLLRGGRLERLTRDHTMAERLREEGLVGRRQRVRPGSRCCGTPSAPPARRRSSRSVTSGWSRATACCCAATASPATCRMTSWPSASPSAPRRKSSATSWWPPPTAPAARTTSPPWWRAPVQARDRGRGALRRYSPPPSFGTRLSRDR